MINSLAELKLSALIGIILGAILVIFAEPETNAGSLLLLAIGLIPSLIVGHVAIRLSKTKAPSNSTDAKDNKNLNKKS
tara:strand:+ start:2489 stop:2722 length:234 start_codon:yes stop_codon:yes gene_type:complete